MSCIQISQGNGIYALLVRYMPKLNKMQIGDVFSLFSEDVGEIKLELTRKDKYTLGFYLSCDWRAPITWLTPLGVQLVLYTDVQIAEVTGLDGLKPSALSARTRQCQQMNELVFYWLCKFIKSSPMNKPFKTIR